MRNMFILLGILIFLLNVCTEGCAELEYDLGQVMITPTKTEQYQSDTGASTTVISSESIVSSGQKTVADVLRRVPGVSITQTGALGGNVSVYLRGAKPGHTLVLIDGVEVNDPISVDRAFNLAHLTTHNIERIEIVRGAQSTLYGSNAIGGVINVITKKGKGKIITDASLEVGSHNTFNETVSIRGSNDRMNYSVAIARTDSEGISSAADGVEEDGYENTTVSALFGVKVLEDSEFLLMTRYHNAELEFDDASYSDDPNYTGKHEQFSSKVEFNQPINEVWEHRLAYSFMNVEKSNRDLADAVDASENLADRYIGFNNKVEWQNNISIINNTLQTCGFEYEEERATFDYQLNDWWGSSIDRLDRKNVENKAYFLQNQWDISSAASLLLGVRADDHEIFGTETTYRVSSVYAIDQTKTRIKLNFGTGFQSPSIYHLYSSYGNVNLKPDESTSYDFGFEQEFLEDKIFAGATFFYNSFNNMIDFDLVDWKFKNIGKAKTSGFETESRIQFADNFGTVLNYTHMKTKDKDTGLKLARRPENEVSLILDWFLINKIDFSLTARYVGARWSNPLNTQKLKKYVAVDLYGAYAVNDQIELFSKIVNLFDRQYQEVTGYNTLDRSVYMGVKGAF
ncbi:MAG: TonB-dependent receptor [PVC group bacterium]|nr:TonB-dependent receptor [PVC group bacterium]